MFIHWEAADDTKIQDYNYEATKEAIQRAVDGTPTAAEATAQRDKVKHPFARLDKRQPRTGKTLGRAGGSVAAAEKALGLLKPPLRRAHRPSETAVPCHDSSGAERRELPWR